MVKYQEDSLVRPQDKHGTHRHLIQHARIADQMGSISLLAQNGDIIDFRDGKGSIKDKIETGRVFIDGKGIGDVGRSILKERKILSEEGFVVVTMILDEESGIVIYGPEINSSGFVFHAEKGYLLEDAKCIVLEVLDGITMNGTFKLENIEKEIKLKLMKYFKFAIQRKPLVMPLLMKVRL